MELEAEAVHELLDQIACLGWDSPAGGSLLHLVREAVVVPAVRRSGLRGPAADQAVSSAWSAAWDALRRPSARRAGNPGGMVAVAVRRALRVEVATGWNPGSGAAWVEAPLSLDRIVDAGGQVAEAPPWMPPGLGAGLEAIAAVLVGAGWAPGQVREAIMDLAEDCAQGRGGDPVTRWRWVALRLGLPEWQVRRLAVLLVGVDGAPGLLELVHVNGVAVLHDPEVQGAVRATRVAGPDGPRAHLEAAARRRRGVRVGAHTPDEPLSA